MHSRPSWFARFAQKVSHVTGRPNTFILALATNLVWAITGPFFGFSDTWQLVDLEELDDRELEALRQTYEKLAQEMPHHGVRTDRTPSPRR